MRPMFLLWLAVSMVAFLSAATASRAYVSSNNVAVLLLSLALYTAGNLVMVRLMREGGLGLSVSASAIVQLLMINIIAFALFGERLTTAQMAGVVLGVLSMGLMLLPVPGRFGQ
jgi:hypothetical protein